jgi:hypothetical protein
MMPAGRMPIGTGTVETNPGCSDLYQEVAGVPIGPVEYIIIEFPGNHFHGEIVPCHDRRSPAARP